MHPGLRRPHFPQSSHKPNLSSFPHPPSLTLVYDHLHIVISSEGSVYSSTCLLSPDTHPVIIPEIGFANLKRKSRIVSSCWQQNSLVEPTSTQSHDRKIFLRLCRCWWMGSMVATKIDPHRWDLVGWVAVKIEGGWWVTELWILGDLIKSDITRKAPLLHPDLIRLF